ncbi:transcriptional regulator [Vibrio albus]|jgi:sigma-E factor negative regulatory protein RseC|uniref:Transcriptional regulator n=1 Tax=Vibrio albus TaxID=2200953 RepID=A0A2U3BCY1_9VIBR|nr:SoxR reducing system RseC family protein [Vibrio albus]PWI34623.1 transcriptional regulator [Vibrio albus]
MMTALATVTAVTESKQGNVVELSCQQQSSCSHCSSKSSCGTGIVSKAVGNKSHKWALITQKKVKPGQMIEIGLPEKKLLQFASVVYLIPIVMLMLGGFLGESLFASGDGEGWVILSAFLCMAAGIWLARKLSEKMQQASEQAITLIRVLGDPVDIG